MEILHKYLAAAGPANPFGTVNAPIPALAGTPEQNLGKLISVAIQAFLVLGSIAALIYMLWGALDWISSGGEKDKVAKAQLKITHAVIGIVALIGALTIFTLVGGRVLNVIDASNGQIKFKLPQFVP